MAKPDGVGSGVRWNGSIPTAPVQRASHRLTAGRCSISWSFPMMDSPLHPTQSFYALSVGAVEFLAM